MYAIRSYYGLRQPHNPRVVGAVTVLSEATVRAAQDAAQLVLVCGGSDSLVELQQHPVVRPLGLGLVECALPVHADQRIAEDAPVIARRIEVLRQSYNFV